MITNIRVDSISPHPDNPRKDLGDLAELAASIKSQGILQNLTIVAAPGPSETHWRVVIGHRRLAAAKLAGLTEVPCAISDMDPKTQVATMLLENMQRSDLTIWEQAQGIQMMLDFGETIGDVAKLTGFSYGTISRRVKLLELDGDKFKKSVARGATLADYAELDKISSVELKNSVLDKIGTSEFQWKLKQSIEQEKTEKVMASMIAEVEKFATRVEKTDGLRQVSWMSSYSGAKVDKPADAGEKKYFFTASSHSIVLYKESSGEEPRGVTGPSAEEQRQLQERRGQLDELNKRAFRLRDAFVRDFTGAKKHTNDIMEFVLWSLIMGNEYDYDYDDLRTVLGIELPADDAEDYDDEDPTFKDIFKMFSETPERVLLLAAYCRVRDDRAICHDWQCRYKNNYEQLTLYSYLERLGYEVSTEERQLMDGTHELYVPPEVKNVGGAVCPDCEKPVKPACVHADDKTTGCCASCDKNKAHNCNSRQPCRKEG